MLEGVFGGDAHLGSYLQHAAEEIEADVIDLRQNEAQVLGGENMPMGLVLGKLADAGPGALAGSAHQPEDLLQLVLVGGAGKERAACVHLGHDAAGGPDVDAGVIGAGAEEYVWRAVPERDDLVRKRIHGDAEGSREAEVGELELALVVDEEVLRLEVAVEDAVLMAEGDTHQELLHKALDC